MSLRAPRLRNRSRFRSSSRQYIMRMSQHFICVVLRSAVAEHEGVQHRMPPEAGALAPDGPKRPLPRL